MMMQTPPRSHLRRLLLLATMAALAPAAWHAHGQATGDPAGNAAGTIIAESVKLPCRDCDGIAVGDITGNGKIDILTSEGKHGVTLWFEQGEDWRQWTRHVIATAGKEIEGNALGDFNRDGTLEAVSLDQPSGVIYLHKHGGDPRGTWRTAAIITGRPLLQDTLVTDIDGDGRPDLVYTWEGRAAGQGGVHWLKLVGDDPLNPEHWRDHVMVQHESAWWLAPRRADLNRDGSVTDIVFTARHLRSRNPGSKPGLFWLQPPARVTDRWTLHTIDTTIPHPLHVDFGDFSGQGHGLDLIVGGFDTDRLYRYDFGDGWKRHELAVPAIEGEQPNRVWNVKSIPSPNGRDAILSPVTVPNQRKGTLLLYRFVDGAYMPTELRRQDYPHPMDDGIALHDLTGDGQVELLVPDSGTEVNVLHILRLKWPTVVTAAAGGAPTKLNDVQARAGVDEPAVGEDQPPEPTSPYDYPYGYPYGDYPLGGASHPRQSANYFATRPDLSGNDEKRIGQYVVRQVVMGNNEEAVAYSKHVLANHADKGKAHYLLAMSQVAGGDLDAAAAHVQQAIEAGLPAGRFIVGPRRMFAPLHDRPVFESLFTQYRHKPVHGPMLGAVTDKAVRVWVRTADAVPVQVIVSESPDLRNVAARGQASSTADGDYTAVISIDGLKPDTAYHYGVLIDGGDVITGEHQRFRTSGAEGKSCRFSVAFGGGGGYHPDNERMWNTIAARTPHALLLLGDNIYIDDPESADMNWYTYYQRQSRPEFRRLVAATPVFAIWDDHDFGCDDSWGGPLTDVPYWKPMVFDIFKQNWANPSYGEPDTPGVWFDTTIGDVHFIFLDGRYYRQDPGRFGDGVENPSMLGQLQLAWLKRTLAESKGRFKVVLSPVPWHDDAKPGRAGLDTWRGFADEREAIFSLIEEKNIEGVLLVAADRHRSDAWKIERQGGYDFYEFMSSRLTNEHRHGVMPDSLFGYNEEPSFGLLHFDTVADVPTVRYEVVNIDGESVHSMTVPLTELQR